MTTGFNITRRTFGAVALSGAVACFTAHNVRGQISNPTSRVRTISNDPLSYHGWPTLAKRADGILLLAYSGGRFGHIDPFGRLELMRSTVGGEAWSAPAVIYDSLIDERDGGIMETPAGTILASCSSIDFYNLKEGKAMVSSPDARGMMLRRWSELADRQTRMSLTGTYLFRSTNGGRSFDPPIRALVRAPHGPTALPDGRLLFAGRSVDSGQPPLQVTQSLDDGLNWHVLATIPMRRDDDPMLMGEPHMVAVDDNHIVLQLRNNNSRNRGETLQSVSDDGGRSWSVPRSINVRGVPSHLLRLADGRLLMSYGVRRKPFGCAVRISADGGYVWSDEIMIYGGGDNADLGYPSTVERDDGWLVTVWYEKRVAERFATLRQLIWRLPSQL